MAPPKRRKTTRRTRRYQGNQGSPLDPIRTYFRQGRRDGGGGAQEQIDAGPAGPEAEVEDTGLGPKPIGVPREYRVPYTIPSRGVGTADAMERAAEAGHGPGSIIRRGPQYYDGDQWKPAAISPGALIQIQKAMVNAGLLTDFRLGFWDENSADAYAEVLTYANAAGISDQMALQQMVESPVLALGGGEGGGSSGRRVIGFDENGDPIYSEYAPPPLEIRTTNREDLKMMLRSLTSEKLGVGWTNEQLDELVDAYNWQEIRVQKSNYDQQVALERQAFNEGPGAIAGKTLTTEEAPSPEAFAEAELIRRDPTGYQAAQVGLKGVDMFREALAGWS